MFEMFTQSYRFVDGLGEPWSSILKGLLVLLIVAFLTYKTVKYVKQDQKAIKLRFGKVVYRGDKPQILGPGVHIIAPFMHSLETVDSRERVIRLKTETDSTFFVEHKDGKPGGLRVAASITVIPFDVHAWRYQSENVENRVADIAITHLQGAITFSDPNSIARDSATFSDELYDVKHQKINEQLARYGAELVAVNIGMCSVVDGQPLAEAVHNMNLRDLGIAIRPKTI